MSASVNGGWKSNMVYQRRGQKMFPSSNKVSFQHHNFKGTLRKTTSTPLGKKKILFVITWASNHSSTFFTNCSDFWPKAM